ncbi:hypothetical protein LTR86_003709 [Recurvomyces mirabilis]|nr:hypothetical protein LTR86_003709 [Recurvomyces mirabilis]
MHYQNILLATFLLITLITAVPINGSLATFISPIKILERNPHLQSPLPNQSSCVAHDYSLTSATYTVQVGVDYADGHGCASIWETLKGVVGHGESGGIHDHPYRCWRGDWNIQADSNPDAQFFDTKLSFDSFQAYGDPINLALSDVGNISRTI